MNKKIHIICLGLVTLNLQLLTPNSFSQNVGINSDGSSPETNTMLDVRSAGNTSATFGLKVKDSDGDTKMVVRSDGNVGIGTTSPTENLEVHQTSSTSFQNSTVNIVNHVSPFNSIIGFTTDADGTPKHAHIGFDHQADLLKLVYGSSFAGSDKGLLINSSGNVGVGYGSTNAKLAVNGSVIIGDNDTPTEKLEIFNGNIHVNSTGRGQLLLDHTTANRIWGMLVEGDGSLVFSTGNSDVRDPDMRTRVLNIQPGGNVGIGTTSPSQALHVVGNICYTGTSSTCSDIRYKKDINQLPDALSSVLEMKGVNYYWKKDTYPEQKFSEEKQIGFIAQDLEKIYPELVVTNKEGYKSVDYSRLTPILVEAIKEQQQIIEALKAEVRHKDEQYDQRLKMVEEYLKTANK